jgi:hypothetical protein
MIIILPRQARDKHRETSKKGRFVADVADGPAVLSITPAVDEVVAFVRDGTILTL